MSDDKLSQEEIDALLRQGSIGQENKNQEAVSQYLSDIEQDAIGEIGNISFGNASTVLSTLLNQKVDITTPRVTVLKKEQLLDEFPKPHIAVHVKYTDGFEGLNLLVIKMDDAKIIADLMLGGDGTNPDPELNEMHLSAVQEAMNQMMGSAATSLSTMFSRRVDISPPGIDIFDLVNSNFEHPVIEEDILLKVSFKMKVGQLIDSEIMQLMPIPFAKKMVGALLNSGEPEDAAQVRQADLEMKTDVSPPPQEPERERQEVQTSSYSSPIEETRPPVSGPTAHERVASGDRSRLVSKESPVVEPVEFAEFDRHPQGSDRQNVPQNLELLMDIPLQVTVELGRTNRTVQEILELAPGSIVELDKLAGEPVDILVNNKLIAKGEVVVIEENFGVRVTDILSQWDRLQKI
jgi:flagellar motor switch protein FliN/FliY